VREKARTAAPRETKAAEQRVVANKVDASMVVNPVCFMARFWMVLDDGRFSLDLLDIGKPIPSLCLHFPDVNSTDLLGIESL
jgi:hypothetical protein